jgi:hypothetical protein
VRTILTVLLLVGSATAAGAQGFEVGMSLATACLGSDGSVCGGGNHPLVAAHASWWAADRIELMARIGRTVLPSRQFTHSFPVEIDVSITDRARDYVSGLFIYHFRRGNNVRPMLGIGAGAFAFVDRVACQPVDCGSNPGLPPSGSSRRWQEDILFSAGLSGVVRDRWIWRGGVITHAFARDHHSAIETFVGVGYRFGAR